MRQPHRTLSLRRIRIGLDETSFARLGAHRRTEYATTVADVEDHQIIDILPTRTYTEVAGWIDKQPVAWKQRVRFGALDMSDTYTAVFHVMLPQARQVVDPFRSPSPVAASTTSAAGSRCSSSGTETTRPTVPAGSFSWARRGSTPKQPRVLRRC